MRSLKIIMFRDTDKPYTVILPASLLVGVSFGIFALVTLLSFSVMGNIMMVQQGGEFVALAQENDTNEDSGDDNQSQDNGELEVAEIGAAEQLPLEEQITPVEEELTTDEQTAEILSDEDDAEVEDNNSHLATYRAPDSEVGAVVVGGIVNATSQVTLQVRVEKTANRGQQSSGYLVIALVDEDDNLGPAFPTRVTSHGREFINPERGDMFRIRQSRTYDISINKEANVQYSGVVLNIYDSESHELLWREMVEL